ANLNEGVLPKWLTGRASTPCAPRARCAEDCAHPYTREGSGQHAGERIHRGEKLPSVHCRTARKYCCGTWAASSDITSMVMFVVTRLVSEVQSTRLVEACTA